uniref:D-2-hydroxyglutarate dehydrogenase, mitochondrial n=1 Tax=Drosophila melanogaster TaxID=7227 RepID=O46096_DROME|nr:CG3835-RB [Drosophila melanogaster]AKD42956.1 CG3835-RC [Drosophila melanogaster]AKD42957.1 CG3835-RA [Drosophila melanogaster]AKD42985.1 CG3835-RB [Drosophila melanogaster]AKD42986.1 CG3835-RC [Drosophila melanogaster]
MRFQQLLHVRRLASAGATTLMRRPITTTTITTTSRTALAATYPAFATTVRTMAGSGAPIPELTEITDNVQRGNYATLTDKDVAHFEQLLGKNFVLTEDLEGYNICFLKRIRGNSKLVLKPGSTAEVAAILKYCNERRLAVVPQGGNTGLVGGSVPICDEIVLSLARLNKVLSVDEVTGIAVVEAGCILENFDQRAREVGLTVPLDLGAKASCHIGGNVSTNAGGVRVVRYGNLHGSVLGVEAVLATGQVLDLMSNFKKDNTGYHMKHLFIGSEGTLGVVTKLSMLCPHSSRAVNVAFIGLNSFDDVLKTFVSAKRNLGEILSSCELIDERALNTALEQFKFLNSPISGFPFYMLIETSGSNGDHDEEKINQFIGDGMERGEIQDGTVTGDPGKVQEIWKIREMVPLGLIEKSFCFKYDISLPLRDFYNIVDVMRERCGPLATVVCGYGHLGDSNLHLNVSCEEFNDEIYKRVEPFVYEYTSKLKGSISAEHGIGFLKKDYLHYSKDPVAIGYMREMKKLLDPNSILNPYKVLN